jgi:hypothetical protein
MMEECCRLRYLQWRSQWNEEQRAAYAGLFYEYPVGSKEDPFDPRATGRFFVHASAGKPYTYLSTDIQDFDPNPSGAMAAAIPMGYKALLILQRLFLVNPGGEVAASWDDAVDAPTDKWTAERDPFLFKVFRPPDPFLEFRSRQSDSKRPMLPEQEVSKAQFIAAEFETLAHALGWSQKRAASHRWPSEGTPLLVTRLISWVGWH